MQGIICSQRLNRDVSELFSSNFNCTASHLSVIQTGDSLNDPGSITLENKVFEGPYRGGRFSFCLNIPANYPFRAVEVWATQPIWHPNIDVRTGKVAVPLDWSPVLTLHSFALAVQMLMLEPSAENAMNLDALSLYISSPQQFDQQVQCSLQGGIFYDICFPCVLMSYQDLNSLGSTQTIAVKRSRESTSTSRHALHGEEEDDDHMEVNDSQDSMNVYPQQKRVCRAVSRFRDSHITNSTDEEDTPRIHSTQHHHHTTYDTPSESPLFGDLNTINTKYHNRLGYVPSPQPTNFVTLNLSTVTANPMTLSPRSQQHLLQKQQQQASSSSSFGPVSQSQKRSRYNMTTSDPLIVNECSKLSLYPTDNNPASSSSPNKPITTTAASTHSQHNNSPFQKFQRFGELS